MTGVPRAAPAAAPTRFATDAEVLELVAAAIDVELRPELDRRRLRRLNSAVGRYRLARRAAARRHCRERQTTRRQVAQALYGPDVELNDVLRQIKRTEADLAAAGLLDVEIATTAGGRPVGVLEHIGTIPVDYSCGHSARRVLCQRPETRRERHERRHAPWRRQQSDRRPRGGVPGLYVRRRDVDELLSNNCQGKARRPVYGTTSLDRPSELNSERDAAARTPAPRRRRRARGRPSAPDAARAEEAAAPRHRWAALSRLRTAGTERAGPERLREAARGGAPPCPVAVAVFEGRFVVDGPWSWGTFADGRPAAIAAGLDGDPPQYRPISERWALRLERYCRQIDRHQGAGAGLLSLIDDVLTWRPEDGAPRGARFDVVDLQPPAPTRHRSDPGWPASLAFFIARLGCRAKQLRRDADPHRNGNHEAWLDRQAAGEVRAPGPDPYLAELNARFADGFHADLQDLADAENDGESEDGPR